MTPLMNRSGDRDSRSPRVQTPQSRWTPNSSTNEVCTVTKELIRMGAYTPYNADAELYRVS